MARNFACIFRYFYYHENVKSNEAIDALGALAHDTRLAAFRLLVRAGPDGMPAGGIADSLGVHPATLSYHLGLLERAGILVSRRAQRQVIYAVRYEGVSGLVSFLTEDCCQGRAEACAPSPLAPAVPSAPLAKPRVAVRAGIG